MKRILALLGLSLMLMFGAAPAQAGGCYGDCDRGCYQRDCCRPTDCCRRKVCYPIYRYETRRIFDGWKYDCDGCRIPRYRYEKFKVYAGKRCTWTGGGQYYRNRSDDDDEAYDPGYRPSYNYRYDQPDYSGANHAFPNYDGSN